MDQEQIDIEYLILADLAQVLGGKLHLMGGGWDRLTVQKFPHIQSFSVAAAVSVPWNHTNEQHNVSIAMIDEDGQKEMFKIDGGFEVGRAPGIKPGSTQRLSMAFGINGFKFSEPNVFSIIASVDGEERRRLVFTVSPTPELQAQLEQGRQSA